MTKDEAASLCGTCRGSGVTFEHEPEGQGTGRFPDGTTYRKGWYSRCKACQGEGVPDGKKVVRPVSFCVGRSVAIHESVLPISFAPNTPENLQWKIGSEKVMGRPNESVWLAPNGVLLIVHGDPGYGTEVRAREDLTGTPAVEARFYAWLNSGVYVGKHADELIEAIEKYNRLVEDKAC